MNKIFLLTDYKGRFGSKHFDKPYRSGMDKLLLKKYFNEAGYEPVFRNFASIDLINENYKDEIILYTSSEDDGYYYKSYIEDIVFSLELSGARVIPSYKFLRANNNKVFMELLRNQVFNENYLETKIFGTVEELKDIIDTVKYPVVIKTAEGASAKGVFLANSKDELIKIAKRISRTPNLFYELWDLGRSFKHKGYLKDSKYRKKFILQSFIPDLKNDWKVYVFFDRYYIFYRPVLKHRGFRASGGGYDNYFYGVNAQIPDGIFNLAKNISDKLGVPNSSLDIAYDGKEFYLIEFQCLYFGTAGILNSEEYFIQSADKWIPQQNNKDIEKTYVYSIINYLKANKL